jgi:sec-independent protein translocase protein TatA
LQLNGKEIETMSISHILLIAVVALVLFGPSKLPELGRAIGRTMREFRKGAEGLMDDIQASAPQDERKDVTPRPSPDPVSGMTLPPSASASGQTTQQAQPVQQSPIQPVQPAQPPQQAPKAEQVQKEAVQPSRQEQAPQQAQQPRQDKPVDTRRLPE